MYILLAVFLLFQTTVWADVYVIHKGTEIFSISQKDDTEIPVGFEIERIKGETLESLSLTRPIDEYSFKDKKFKVDADKIKAKEDKQLAEEKAINDKKEARKSGIDKLKALGLTEAEITAMLGK